MASAASTAAPQLPPSPGAKLGEPLSVDFAVSTNNMAHHDELRLSPPPAAPVAAGASSSSSSSSPPSPAAPSRSRTAPLPLRLDTDTMTPSHEASTSRNLLVNDDNDAPLAASPLTASTILHHGADDGDTHLAAPPSHHPPGGGASSSSRPASISLRVPATDTMHRSNHPRSLAGYLDAHPQSTVAKAIRKTYPKPLNPITRIVQRFTVKHNIIKGLSEAELQRWDRKHGKRAAEEAGWTHPLDHDDHDQDHENSPPASGRPRPSDLFWKMYLSILPTVQRHPLSGLCAPPLLGSTTTMPLTIVSLIPDIMKHYRDVIVRAKKEVFLVTNYWQPSNSVNTIAGALRELSEIQMKRDPQTKIVVKLIYDRGSFEQLWNAHAPVQSDGWAGLKIPLPEEIPGLSLEVVNFHKVLLGTFHAKFLIVDRKVALINSNNIQDRPNLELMTHLEGPIVDSFYEVALHSWYNKLEPMLPCINTAYRPPAEGRYLFKEANPYLQEIEVVQAAKAARQRLRKETQDAQSQPPEQGDRFRDVVRKAMENAAFNMGERWDELFDAREGDGNAAHPFRDWADKVRAPFSKPGSRRASFDGDMRLPRRQSAPAIQHRDELESEAPSSITQVGGDHTDKNTNGGWKKMKQGLRDMSPARESRPHIKIAEQGNKSMHTRTPSNRLVALTERFNNTGVLSEAPATVEDTDELDTFQPHILHRPHAPFPVALVNRKPQGMPGHHDIRNPQNAAWLAGCRYAKRKVFIQTPTLNARPIRRAVKQACRRGVQVELFLDLGFNDKGESIPFQGGTNEQVVERLYSILRSEGKDQFLKVYWYTGKDQIRPLNAVHKQRNCHIKFAVYDDEVAILGNGNQDTQSWMHSQETNIMIDNKEVIAEIMATLYTNQNTQLYGLVGNDGIWRDADGHDISKYDSAKKGRHQGLAGFIQFAKTI